MQDVHQAGGYGSVGYGYSWKRAEAEKNLLRTHTTAVSSRMVRDLHMFGSAHPADSRVSCIACMGQGFF